MAALWPPREYCDLRSPRDYRCCIAMHRLLYNGISRKEGRRANTHHFPFFPPSPPFIPGGIPCPPCLLSGCQNAFLSSLIWKQESVCADVGGGSPNVCLGSICEEEEEEEAKSVRGVCAQSPLYPKPKTNEPTNRKRGTLLLSPPPPPPPPPQGGE